MTTPAVLGIDCGTTVTKLSLISLCGPERFRLQLASPVFRQSAPTDAGYATALWRKIARGTELAHEFPGAQIEAIAIAAISPVLVAFEFADPDRALAMPYWPLPLADGGASGLDRSVRRAAFLARHAKHAGIRSPVLCDLVGYLNFRLCGRLSLNTITAGEMGCRSVEDVREIFVHRETDVLAPAEAVGRHRGHAVCAGASDSFAAALALAASRARSRLIYLGTFGSVLEGAANITEGLHHQRPSTPYVWRLSVPRFGRAIEGYAAKIAGGEAASQLKRLDALAGAAPPGAESTYLALPVWDTERRTLGQYRLTAPANARNSVKARAVLEALGYAIRGLGLNSADGSGFVAAGGGAASAAFVGILADTLGQEIEAFEAAGGALAPAWIGADAAGSSFAAMSASAAHSISLPHQQNYEATTATAAKAAAYYRRLQLA